jgi:hypothetical protein
MPARTRRLATTVRATIQNSSRASSGAGPSRSVQAHGPSLQPGGHGATTSAHGQSIQTSAATTKAAIPAAEPRARGHSPVYRPGCGRRKARVAVRPAGYAAARSANFAYCEMKESFTLSVGPFLCLATITSAMPGSGESSGL